MNRKIGSVLMLAAPVFLSACGGGEKQCDAKQLVCVSYSTTDDGTQFAQGTAATNPAPVETFGIVMLGNRFDNMQFTIDPKHTNVTSISAIELVPDSTDTTAFTLDTSTTNLNLAANGQTSFRVSFRPATVGKKTATIKISGTSPTLAATEYSFQVSGTGAVINGAANFAWEKAVAGGYTAQKDYHVRQAKEGTCGPTSLYIALQHFRKEFSLGDAGYAYGDIDGAIKSLKEDFPDGSVLSTKALISKYLGTGAMTGTQHPEFLAGIEELKKDSAGAASYFSAVQSRSNTQEEPANTELKRQVFHSEVEPLLMANYPVIFHTYNHYSVIIGYDDVHQIVYWTNPSKDANQAPIQSNTLEEFLSSGFLKGRRWDSRYYGMML